jgi:hypothetical protein
MKILIISLNNLYLTPYLDKYTTTLKSDKFLVYWNRSGIIEEKADLRLIPFNFKIGSNSSKFTKLIGYIKFLGFVKKTLKSIQFDKLIVFQTIIALFINKILVNEFKKKFIIDIRDYTRENNLIYRAFLQKLTLNSFANIISSEGFLKFLPKSKYFLTHNIKWLGDIGIPQSSVKKEKIVISYIGLIRFYDECKKVIKIFKDDQRFILNFIGEGSGFLKKYCELNNVKNVNLVGRFSPELTLDYYNDADIIYNLYGNQSPLVKYALSNKLYYAIQLRKPIAVNKDTFMEEISNKFNLAITFDLNNRNLPNIIYKKFNEINIFKLGLGASKFLKIIKNDEDRFISLLKEFDL